MCVSVRVHVYDFGFDVRRVPRSGFTGFRCRQLFGLNKNMPVVSKPRLARTEPNVVLLQVAGSQEPKASSQRVKSAMPDQFGVQLVDIIDFFEAISM